MYCFLCLLISLARHFVVWWWWTCSWTIGFLVTSRCCYYIGWNICSLMCYIKEQVRCKFMFLRHFQVNSNTISEKKYLACVSLGFVGPASELIFPSTLKHINYNKYTVLRFIPLIWPTFILFHIVNAFVWNYQLCLLD